MFFNSKSNLLKSDLPIILRGLFLFFAITIVGIGATRHQLANLTQKNDTAVFFPASFLSYFESNNNYRYFSRLTSGEFFQLYQPSEVIQKDDELIFKLTGYKFSTFDLGLGQVKTFFNPLVEKFREVAYRFRNDVRSYLSIIKEAAKEEP